MCTTTERGKVKKRVWGLPVPLGPKHWESPWNWVLWVRGGPHFPEATSHRGGQGIRTADFSKNLKAAATPAVFLQSKQNMTLVNSTGLLKLQLVGVPLGKPHMIFFFIMYVWMWEKKKRPLEGFQILTRVGLGFFFFFSVYARYFSTTCHIEGQSCFVPSEAQPVPKAAASSLFCQLDLTSKWDCGSHVGILPFALGPHLTWGPHTILLPYTIPIHWGGVLNLHLTG